MFFCWFCRRREEEKRRRYEENRRKQKEEEIQRYHHRHRQNQFHHEGQHARDFHPHDSRNINIPQQQHISDSGICVTSISSGLKLGNQTDYTFGFGPWIWPKLDIFYFRDHNSDFLWIFSYSVQKYAICSIHCLSVWKRIRFFTILY